MSGTSWLKQLTSEIKRRVVHKWYQRRRGLDMGMWVWGAVEAAIILQYSKIPNWARQRAGHRRWFLVPQQEQMNKANTARISGSQPLLSDEIWSADWKLPFAPFNSCYRIPIPIPFFLHVSIACCFSSGCMSPFNIYFCLTCCRAGHHFCHQIFQSWFRNFKYLEIKSEWLIILFSF